MTRMIPYGITDFARIRRENYYYVDKTMFIEEIERQPSYLFLIRPRRFGKSLTLIMLSAYYDVNYADQFEELFGGLYVGEHPTPLHNRFLIMRFNFANVNPNPGQLEENFDSYCKGIYDDFISRYAGYFDADFGEKMKALPRAPEQLELICHTAVRKGLKIYLMIDEYDNFTNTILSDYGKDRYAAFTHGDGIFRFFFNKVKGMTTELNAAIERLFITGVSPVTMDDVTSGFNIGTNITTDAPFNSLVGFSEQEVREMLEYYHSEGVFTETIDEVLATMKPYYDNYCFSVDCLNDCMFNSDMTLYFLSTYFRLHQKPKELIDPNVRTDFNKLSYLVRLDQELGENVSVIREIAEKGEIVTDIVTHFSAEEMTDTKNFKSLLFYFGMLSIKGMDIMGRPILHVPNLVVREQLFNFLVNGYRKFDLFKIDFLHLTDLMGEMAFHGDWHPLFDFLADAIRTQSRIREYIEGEAHVKGFLLAYLGMFRYYELYPEYEMNKGFADFFFKPSPAAPALPPYTYLLEVKYCKAGSSDAEVQALAADAREQLLHYAQDELVAAARKVGKLKLITAVWRSWELMLTEETAI